MSTMFSITGKTPNRDLSVFYANGDNATVPESHESFQQLLNLVMHGAEDEEVRNLVNIIEGAARRLTTLSERVSVKGNELFFDGDPIVGSLVDAIIELHVEDSERLGSVVNFLEKVKTNPDISSIDGLWKWVEKGDLVLHEDGDFLAYKGCVGTGAGRTSKQSGKAFVNGEEVTGQIPNPDGAVISMPRSKVDDGGYQACSTGLHAATHSFAKGFVNWESDNAEVILIKVNPRDVVSVPQDESFQKLRVCRYTVLHAVSGRLDGRLYVQPEIVPEPEEDVTPSEALWGYSALGDEEDVAGDPIEEMGVDEDDDEDDEPTPKLEALAEREPVWEKDDAEDDVPEENPFSEDDPTSIRPYSEVADEVKEGWSEEATELREQVGEAFRAEVEKAQSALRDANGRFTKEGARKEAIAGKRDALGRFIKNS